MVDKLGCVRKVLEEQEKHGKLLTVDTAKNFIEADAKLSLSNKVCLLVELRYELLTGLTITGIKAGKEEKLNESSLENFKDATKDYSNNADVTKLLKLLNSEIQKTCK